MSNTTQDFLQKDLIKELGLDNLPEEKKAKFILKIGELVQQNMILRILNELSETDKDELDKIMAANNGDKTFEFLQSKIPNLEDIAREEIAKFKQDAMIKAQAIFA